MKVVWMIRSELDFRNRIISRILESIHIFSLQYINTPSRCRNLNTFAESSLKLFSFLIVTTGIFIPRLLGTRFQPVNHPPVSFFRILSHVMPMVILRFLSNSSFVKSPSYSICVSSDSRFLIVPSCFWRCFRSSGGQFDRV